MAMSDQSCECTVSLLQAGDNILTKALQKINHASGSLAIIIFSPFISLFNFPTFVGKEIYMSTSLFPGILVPTLLSPSHNNISHSDITGSVTT